MQGKKFISPGAWFSMNYPSDWNEFEDGEGSFLFYNPDVWTGNFRISAFKGNASYGKDAIRQELKENDSASLVKIGTWDCAYSKEMFQEEVDLQEEKESIEEENGGIKKYDYSDVEEMDDIDEWYLGEGQ